MAESEIEDVPCPTRISNIISSLLSRRLYESMTNMPPSSLTSREEWLTFSWYQGSALHLFKNKWDISDRVQESGYTPLIPLYENEELEDAYCDLLRTHQLLNIVLRRIGENRTEFQELHCENQDQHRMKEKNLQRRWKLDAHDFQNVVRDLHLSIAIENSPEWVFSMRLSTSKTLKHCFEEDRKIRDSINRLDGKELFFEFLEFLKNLIVAPLEAKDLNILASKWYYAVLEDDYSNCISRSSKSQHPEISICKNSVPPNFTKYSNVYRILVELSPGLENENNLHLIKDTIRRGSQYVRQLLYFDYHWLIARIYGNQSVKYNQQHEMCTWNPEAVSTFDHSKIASAARWLGTITDFFIPNETKSAVIETRGFKGALEKETQMLTANLDQQMNVKSPSALQWLFQLCLVVSKTSELESLELMAQIIDLLQGPPISSSIDQQASLVDLIGFEHIEKVTSIVNRQDAVVKEFKKRSEEITAQDLLRSMGEKQKDQKESPSLGKHVVVRSAHVVEKEKQDRKKLKKARLKGAISPSELEGNGGGILAILERLGLDHLIKDDQEQSNKTHTTKKPALHKLLTGKCQFSPYENLALEGMGLKRTLPEGTKHTFNEGIETFIIPPGQKRVVNEDELLPITVLPDWAQSAFPYIKKFNSVQSRVFHSAFEKSENILISAPTGAGKTNIALLTILQQVSQHRHSSSVESAKTFKIVYIAPMKSLVAEITNKYTEILAPLGINVQELTADMQLTRKQIDSVHLIVTVPEKWDILTRSAMTGGISSDASLMSALCCLIVDEIHLLNDSRGPVIEAIIARTFRYIEARQKPLRIVGLSATLPNWVDISVFLRVSPENVFHFGSSYRPVPLEQTITGISENDPIKRLKKFNIVCYEHVETALKKGYQAMIFVHMRGETQTSADALLDLAKERKQQKLFDLKLNYSTQRSKFEPLVRKARDQHVKRLFDWSIGIHHAGMLRNDRSLVERMFLEGALRVLCCTATLAWGVNLPARYAIIKGTNIFDSKDGGYRDIGILDVLQIFGRAGRPQFDDEGHAVLITTQNKIQLYLRQLTNQVAIESQFISNIANALNAEVCMGNVTNEAEGSLWLAYTYFYVRLLRSPQTYGISIDQLEIDPEFTEVRRQIISKAADLLEEAHLIRISRTDFCYSPTQFGRIAAKFYIDWNTAKEFRIQLRNTMDDAHVLQTFGKAEEFEGLKVRNEEMNELRNLSRQQMGCFIQPIGGVDNIEGKVSVLLQAYLSRTVVEGSSLVSDCYYIQQNASRLMRAFFETSLAQSNIYPGASAMVERLLEWCKMLERRLSTRQHVLRHFCYPNVFSERDSVSSQRNKKDRDSGGVIKEWAVRIFENKELSYWRLMEMNVSELSSILKVPNEARQVYKYLRRVPNIKITLRVQPITSTIMKIVLMINAQFEWSDKYHGSNEPFRIWVENPDTQILLHWEEFLLNKKKRMETQVVTFMVPLSQGEEAPVQYIVKVISERWVGVSFQEEFSVKHLLLPDRIQSHTSLLDLHPLPVKALHNDALEKLYTFSHFNPIQTQAFHTLYHSSFNVLLGAPTGSGKTIVAELAIFALFRDHPQQKVIYIAPLKALARERINDWKERFGNQLGKRVVELTGDFTPDIRALESANVVVTTPEKWDGISRHWKKRKYVCDVGLVIIDEIHLLGLDRGPILEVIVSRMRYISTQTDRPIRFIGLSTALANAHDIADWLGIGRVGLFNFRPSVRPVPCVVHIQGFPLNHYCPRMATMNKPAFQAIKAYSPNRPVLIFVSSRRQTRLTALDLIGLCAIDDPKQFVNYRDEDELHEVLATVTDETLTRTLEFGVGMHHAGLQEKDRVICEQLFLSGKIQVLITTSTLAWGVNLPAHLVIIKGTEYYDGKLSKYVDMPITDVLQMMGRAGRPQFDKSAVACIFVHEPKKDFYRKFIYEPFPVESCLHNHIDEHLNAEICSATIQTRQEALDYMTWTYLFRRLIANPAYYNASVLCGENDENGEFPDFSFSGKRTEISHADVMRRQRQQISDFLEGVIDNAISRLVDNRCIEVKEPSADMLKAEISDPLDLLHLNLQLKRHLLLSLHPTRLGKIASAYYLQTTTVSMFYKKLSRESRHSWIDLIQLLCDCHEYGELPVRHNEDDTNLALSKNCPFDIDKSKAESPHTKAFLLLQAHLFGISLPITDYITDLKSVLDQSLRIVQAMADIASHLGNFTTTINICLVLQSLMQGSHPYRNPLFTLPHFTDKTIQNLKQLTAGDPISSLYQLIELSYGKQQGLIEELFSSPRSVAKSVLRVLREFPKLRIELQLQQPCEDSTWTTIEKTREGEYVVESGSKLLLIVTLIYLNSPSEFGYTPKFPKKKTYGWWCLFGDTFTDELIGLRRLGNLRPSKSDKRRIERTSIGFSVPPLNANDPKLTVCALSLIVLSDCYLGIDQQVDLKLIVMPTLRKYEESEFLPIQNKLT